MKKNGLFLVTLFIMFNLSAQWSDNSIENVKLIKDTEIHHTDIQASTVGGCYFYYDRLTALGVLGQYLQFLDKDGVKQWDEDLLVSNNYSTYFARYKETKKLFVDKDNNAIIIAGDIRHDTTNRGITYTLYKISPEGKHLWNEEGVLMTETPAPKRCHIKVTQIADGSYIFAWNNTVNSISVIELQRVSADGKILWGQKSFEGVYPYLVDAGDGDAILAYAKGAAQTIYAKKLSFDGSEIWGQDTKVYDGGGFPSAPLYINLRVEPANGGVLLGWFDDRSGTGLGASYCSYIKNDGTHGFSSGVGGQQLGYSQFRKFNPSMVFDTENSCIYAVWVETTPSQGFSQLVNQKLSLDGSIAWDPNGIILRKLDSKVVGYHSIRLGPNNTVATFFTEDTVIYKHTNASMILQNADASFVWEDTSVIIANGVSAKMEMISTSFSNEQWVCIWKDARSPGDLNRLGVYGQNVNANGVLGIIETSNMNEILVEDNSIQLTIYPNPTIGLVNIKINSYVHSNVKASVDVVDYSGRIVKKVYNGFINTGENLFKTNVEELASGMYFIRISTKLGIYSSKIVVK